MCLCMYISVYVCVGVCVGVCMCMCNLLYIYFQSFLEYSKMKNIVCFWFSYFSNVMAYMQMWYIGSHTLLKKYIYFILYFTFIIIITELTTSKNYFLIIIQLIQPKAILYTPDLGYGSL